MQNFEVVTRQYAIFLLFVTTKFGRQVLIRSDFPPEKFYFEFFSLTNAVSIIFGLRRTRRQSLKEIDFPTRNAVDPV